MTLLSGRLKFVPAATNSEKYTIPFSTSSFEAIDAHVELKSLGVVSVRHDDGGGSAGEAKVKDALNSAAHMDSSTFILRNAGETGNPADPHGEGLVPVFKVVTLIHGRSASSA